MDYIQSRLSIKSCLEKFKKVCIKFNVSAYNKVKGNKEGTKKYLDNFKKSIDNLKLSAYNKSIEAKHQIKSHWWLRVKKFKKL